MILGDVFDEKRCTDEDNLHLFRLLKDLKCARFGYHEVNYIKIPKNCRPLNQENILWFNEIYQTILNDSVYTWNKIKWTKSGGISKKTVQPAYDVIQRSNATIEMVIYDFLGSFRIIMGKDTVEEVISGSDSFREFVKICNKHDIDLSDFAITNGEEVKKEIEKPKIELVRASKGVTYKCAHHLDINSSYMAGIAEAFPELDVAIQEIYKGRKQNPVNKHILTHSFGFFQSRWCNIGGGQYTLAHMSKAAISFNNRLIEDLTRRLEAADYDVLAYNTDGIWYYGDEEPFHDYDEGTELGQWKNDHVGVQLRFKSKGAYEFIEDGKVNVVLRGLCALDKIKKRDEWDWDDLFSDGSEVLKARFIENIGFVFEEE